MYSPLSKEHLPTDLRGKHARFFKMVPLTLAQGQNGIL